MCTYCSDLARDRRPGREGVLSDSVFTVVKSGLFLLPRQFRAAFMRLSGLGRTCGVAGGTPDVTNFALRADFAPFLLYVVSIYISNSSDSSHSPDSPVVCYLVLCCTLFTHIGVCRVMCRVQCMYFVDRKLIMISVVSCVYFIWIFWST